MNNQVNWVSDPYLFNDPFEFSHQRNFHLDENGEGKYVQGEELKKLEQIRESIKEYGVVCYSILTLKRMVNYMRLITRNNFQ